MASVRVKVAAGLLTAAATVGVAFAMDGSAQAAGRVNGHLSTQSYDTGLSGGFNWGYAWRTCNQYHPGQVRSVKYLYTVKKADEKEIFYACSSAQRP